MQKKKIFVEINLSRQLAKRLSQLTAKWQSLPIKWTKEDNLHITVAFVGYVDESIVGEICQKVSDAVADCESFELDFNSIELGPDEENPKMVWLIGESSPELGMLNEKVEKALGMQGQAHKQYRPHVTLGRIRKLKWEKLGQKPVIKEKAKFAMTVDSISVMESRGGGAEYISLEDCPLS